MRAALPAARAAARVALAVACLAAGTGAVARLVAQAGEPTRRAPSPLTTAGGIVGRRSANDTVPVPDIRVLLHEVAAATCGPIDSTTTDSRGRFHFRFHRDTGAVYLTSARHDGIEYFSTPLAVTAGNADTGVRIVVADTSSAAPVAVAARHVVVTRPADDGGRSVLDLTVIRNAGDHTHVAPDTIHPSWIARLPAGTEALDVGEGDFSPAAVARRGDSLLVFAPIAPGDKQLTVEYRLPPARRTIGFGFGAPVRTFNLLVEEPDARVTGFRSATVDTQTVETRVFRRWTGSVAAGDTVRVEFHPVGTGPGERWVLLALVGALALALVVAARRFRLLSVLLAVLPALGTISGCRPPAARRGAIELVDDAGDTTALAAPARRVVSLVPATTELLFAIGAGNAVAGRTTWCDYPPAATAVPSVGDGLNPNVEAVLARRPDLVIFYRSAQQAAVVARLRALGIPAVQLATDALADVPRVARALGRLTGHERGADSVATTFTRELAAVTANGPATPAARRPKVLLLVWEQPPMTVGTGSFLSELVTHAGGVNLFADIPASSATVSIEAIAQRDPDLVLLTSEGATALTQPAWQVVRAVRDRRFVRVSGSAFGHPGPRSPAAIAELARRFRVVLP